MKPSPGSDPLDPRDAVFLFTESPGHRSHLVATNFFDLTDRPGASIDRAQIHRWMTARLGLEDFFTHRIEPPGTPLGYPRWVSAAPLLDEHVFLHRVTDSGWQPVQAVLAELLQTGMDLSRPPWELHVIQGVRHAHHLPDQVVGVLLKVHHCAADGMRVRSLVDRMFADAPTAVEPASPESAPRARPAWVGAAALRFLVRRVRYHRAVRRLDSAAGPGRAPNSTRTVLNARAGGGIGIDFLPLAMADLTAIRRTVPGATVNDVLLGIVAGALRRHLGTVGTTVSLTAKVPVSLRGPADAALRNRLTLLAVPLHNRVDDPLARLRLISAAARAGRERYLDPAVRAHGDDIADCPALVLHLRTRWAARTNAPSHGNTTVSNIAMAADHHRFFGAPYAGGLACQPPIDGDLVRHYLTWRDRETLLLTVCADPAAVPDPAGYCAAATAAVAELIAAAGGSAPTITAPAAADPHP